MADPVAGVEKIVKLGLAIKEAVDTVRHNEEECHEIRKRVLRFSAILSQLQQTGLMNDSPAMSGALEDLEESLQHALELVTACQETSTIRRLIKAGDLSKQLHRVKDDILNKVMLASFAVNTQATIVLLTIQAGGGHPLPRQPEDAGVVDSTDDARTELNDVENNVIAGSEVPLAPLLVEFTWSELKVATNSFSDGNIIARGSCFIVYKGVLKGGNIVAIKSSHAIKKSYIPEYYYSLWPRKIYDLLPVVSKLHHENIVKFVGYCYQVLSTSKVQLFKRKKEFLWVEEYVANGSLQDIIHDSRIHWSSLFQIIQGIAQGLHYLHEQHVVHMDVKPLNILLDSDMNPKITDFEASIVLPDNKEIIWHDSITGTMGYIDPDYMSEGIVSTKNDVYAFGTTLLETVSSMCRSKPPEGLHRRDREAWKAELMKEEFDPALFEASDLEQIRRCIQIGLVCAQLDRARRPNMDQVLEMLNGNKKFVLLTIQAGGGHPPPRQPEDAGVVDSTDDAREYIDPEFVLTGILSTKIDVYAFGITLLETVSSMCRSKPPHQLGCEAWKAELMKTEFDPTLFEASDLKQIRRCIQIGFVCAQLDTECRPNMDQVLEMLSGNKELPNT